MKQTILGAICLSLAASIWGGMYVVSKYVLDFIPPLTLVWLRFIIAFVVLYFILKIAEKKQKKKVVIRKKDWLLFAWIGFIGYFISITCQFIGTKLSDAHTGSLVTSATPAFMVIFAALILKEKLTARRLLSTIIATIGVIIVIGWDIEIGSYFIGTIILVGAAITWALLSIYVKIASIQFSSLVITTYAIFFSLFFITPFMIWELQTASIGTVNTYVILGVLYLGIVSTAGAFFLWNKGLELLDASIGSLFFFFQPIVGSLLGWLLLNETLNSNFFIGGILIICSVLITTFEKK
ncbi:drug/metabolite exporter family protein [Bacillus cereus BAG1X2-3]|jgi:drug/metabolite transporter (DMT)-like permease|uniref:EamA/RhaT family transporter n=2 Tax=Bacillus cereus group TaxID=86661 RepID=A0A9X7ANP0_BACTU|nr:MULTISPECIES: DMT family transporter [Bacillus]EOO28397.1 drug/metabolite exporter family protein [Bacillus cereus BAG1X1-1]EOO47804.1 drug/metabolite exporter family protein [Bacillus cereus BAG1X2-1]EOO53149.1 drug/metabolite exporter family protein [Bacillus cereus BAG1X2-2]EOO59110.1 drug/metabolite exporter family protein [Bacillus cereus BAG1X2-3]EOP05119.1 drug/metabolite exporter family protein [Bacillus cereus BAG2O-1]